MRIKKLSYYDDEYKWKLNPIELLPNFNLLVGISGAGKTTLLRAIENLKAIGNGASLNGVEWDICFLNAQDDFYHWTGKFETKESTIHIDNETTGKKQVRIIHENLTCNQAVLVKRTSDEIIFNGVKTPKLSPFESIIDLLKEEDSIVPVKTELDKIILTDSGQDFDKMWRLPVSIFKKHEKLPLAYLKESDLPIFLKLAITYRIFPEEFGKIKKAFMNIFPNVSDIKIESLQDDDIPIALSRLLKEATTVSIKEKGVQDWIKNISSGMFKTLMYISELYLSPDDCVILIDEFENSLGVNCLDNVTDLILSNRKSQFIITSHHPYVINNISPAYWKIVTRQGSLVTVKDAKDFHIPDSRQKAFIDLINVLQNEEDADKE